MEHAALHAGILLGLLLAVAGPLAGFWFVPGASSVGATPAGSKAAEGLVASLRCWTARGAVLAACAIGIDFFVQVAELQGLSIFGGLDLPLAGRFVSTTTVGRLGLAGSGLLLGAAAMAQWGGRQGWRFAAVFSCGGARSLEHGKSRGGPAGGARGSGLLADSAPRRRRGLDGNAAAPFWPDG